MFFLSFDYDFLRGDGDRSQWVLNPYGCCPNGFYYVSDRYRVDVLNQAYMEMGTDFPSRTMLLKKTCDTCAMTKPTYEFVKNGACSYYFEHDYNMWRMYDGPQMDYTLVHENGHCLGYYNEQDSCPDNPDSRGTSSYDCYRVYNNDSQNPGNPVQDKKS